MGVRFPLPAPSIRFICNDLPAGKRHDPGSCGTYGTVRILFILNNLRISCAFVPSLAYVRLDSLTLNYGLPGG